jgi:hypothetical protein
MRVAQANGLYAQVVNYAQALEGELKARKAIDRSTLRTAAIELLDKILTLFESMNIRPSTRDAVLDAKTSLEFIGSADLSDIKVRESVAGVLSAIRRTFSGTHFG